MILKVYILSGCDVISEIGKKQKKKQKKQKKQNKKKIENHPEVLLECYREGEPDHFSFQQAEKCLVLLL